MTEDTTKPGIQERYVTARLTSNMRVDPKTSMAPADVIAAAGAAGQVVPLEILLWQVTYEGKTEAKKRLADELGELLNKRMAVDRRLKGDAWKVASEMVAWHLHGVCPDCEGRGLEHVRGTPYLSAMVCRSCGGTGKRPYPREAAYTWMADEISRMISRAAGETMKRLNNDLRVC